jgi:CelD/BcsL family acetyltransferase involved in cellulose biosynthesis
MARYTARRLGSFADLADRMDALGDRPGATPFQSRRWLGAFYAAFGTREGVTPLPIEVRDQGGRIACLLPLLAVRHGRLTAVEFADLGITDYNLPILGPAAPSDRPGAEALWAAVRRALPPADVAVFTKMPLTVDGRANPIVEALPTEPSTLFGNYVAPGDDYEAWLHTLEKHDRKELARFWRVFTREPDTRFVRARTVAEAEPILGWIEEVQAAKIRSLGLPYLLDDPDYAGFYRRMLADGIADGTVVVTALMAGEEVVAALYGIADGRQYAMVRIASAAGRWANASPGRLVIERSIALLHGEGYRWFDFTIGDYLHKRGFSAAHTPLADATVALSVRGLPSVGIERAKAFVKHRPGLERIVRRMLRRAA